MIKVTMLGTSGSTPTKDRSLPGVLLAYDGNSYLFDCGEGTQMQMMKFGANISKIRCIFLTHLHGDHVIGIAGLLRTLALNNREEELTIFIPRGYESRLKSLIVFDKAMIRYKITIKGVRSGEIYKGKNFSVSAFKLDHTVATFGYVFKESDRFKFLVDKCKALGIKDQMFTDITRNGKTTVNGKLVRLKQVTVAVKGKKIVYASDTRPCAATVVAAKDCDLLIHEANYATAQEQMAKDRKHSTAHEAARIAKKARARKLVLTHISARYRDTSQLLREARGEFKNSFVAFDGYTIDI